MWLMLQRDVPGDFVVATGTQHSVRDFVVAAFACVNKILTWHGSGKDEVGKVNDKVVVRIDPHYFRPTEVSSLLGNAAKIQLIGWAPKVVSVNW